MDDDSTADKHTADNETSEDRWGDAANMFGLTKRAAACDIRSGHFVSIMVDGEWRTGEVETKLELRSTSRACLELSSLSSKAFLYQASVEVASSMWIMKDKSTKPQ